MSPPGSFAAPDVIFVSYGEPNAEENFSRLCKFAPAARRLTCVSGLQQGYQDAAALSATALFFMVDGDLWIRDGFEFAVPEGPAASVCFWRAINPVNGLNGFMGGLKLLRREAVRAIPPRAVDPLLAIPGPRRTISTPAGETRFNASPFLAWKAAFRECAKLTAGVVSPPRRRERLEIWQTVGGDRLNGGWCLLGARMGAAFGAAKGADLSRLTDHAALQRQFETIAVCPSGAPADPFDLLKSAPLVF